MNVWTSTEFKGHWPVLTAAVVIADTAERAAELLNEELRTKHFLQGDAKPEDMVRLKTKKEAVTILSNGEY